MKVKRTPGRAGNSAKMHYFVVNNQQVVCKQRHSKKTETQVFPCENLIYAYFKAFFTISDLQASFLHVYQDCRYAIMLFKNV